MVNSFFERANELKGEMIDLRRTIHHNAGVGFQVRQNADLIREELKKVGIDAKEICECGIVATIGNGGKCILLRADYDALPMTERSGLPFAAENGTCHACGHDFNATSLIFAAKMLKERESELQGTVKLMFQPAEEIGTGAKAMIESGLMENPKVDAAVALHCSVGGSRDYVGTTGYTRGPMFASCDKVEITIKGKGGHGGMPHNAVNPLLVASHIIVALEGLLANEVDSAERNVLTICGIRGGEAPNVIAAEVTLLGTLRTVNPEVRAYLKRRIVEISQSIAVAMRTEAVCDLDESSLPATVTSVELCDTIHPYLAEVCGEENVIVSNGLRAMGSEDFSEICERVPAVICAVGAGSSEEGYCYPVHNPHVIFNEDCLPYGAALFANIAHGWLTDHCE